MHIKLCAETVWTKVVECDRFPYLRNSLRFRPPGYFYTTAYQNGSWDGYKYLISEQGFFLSGLLPYMVQKFESMGYSVDVQDNQVWFKKRVTVDPSLLEGITLRPYQTRTIEKMIYNQRGICEVPTGGGKTEIMAGFLKKTMELGLVNKALIIVNKINLMHQTVKRLIDRGIPKYLVGYYGGGLWQDGMIIVGVVNSVHNSLSSKASNRFFANVWSKDVDALIYDETHHLPANTWGYVGKSIAAPFRLGVSATPFFMHSEEVETEEQMSLMGMTGRLIVQIPVDFMVANGYLAKPIVCFLPMNQKSAGITPVFGDYHAIYKAGIDENVERNMKILKLATGLLHGANHSVMVLVNHVLHGDFLMRLMINEYKDTALWENTVFAYGSQMAKFINENGELYARKFKYDDFKSFVSDRGGKPFILIGSPAYAEGVDIPCINSIIIATGDKSHIQVIQKAGRALRPKTEGVNSAYIFDFKDTCHAYLRSNFNSRKKAYERASYSFADNTMDELKQLGITDTDLTFLSK